MVSGRYVLKDRALLVRLGHSEERLWHELRKLLGGVAFGIPLALAAAGLGGYLLARRALAPVDAMRREAAEISAESLSERLPVENPEDELGQLARVLNQSLDRLQAAFQQLRRFTADASHELRTPLTAVRSVGEVALQDKRAPEEYREAIGSMLEEVDRLTRLVDSLLVLSRADAGQISLNRMRLPLVEVVQEAVSLVEVLAEEKGQQVRVESEPAIAVSADRLILRQALINLLDNAIKYSPAEARVNIRLGKRNPREIVVEVVDQGPGIPSEHRQRVFERFYRVDPARSREQGGAGLGLAIADWAVKAHGGSLELESEEGRGSTFRIVLPTADPADNET
jgi:heavy metal sensor kinase